MALGNCGVGELAGWELGAFGSWAIVEFGTRGARDLANCGVQELGSWRVGELAGWGGFGD